MDLNLAPASAPGPSPGFGTTDAASPGDAPSFDLWRFYSALLKRAWLVATVLVISVAGAAFYGYRARPYYRAEASVVIDLNPPQVLKGLPEVVDLGSGNFWSTKEYFETQYRILKSRQIAVKVVARLGLDRDADFLHVDPKLSAEERDRILKNPGNTQAAVDMLIGMIQVVPVKDSRVVLIAIEDVSPQRAADLSNAVVEEYIEQNVDRKLATTHSASAWLAGQLAGVRKKLDDAATTLFKFKEQHDVLTTSLESRQNINSERLVLISDSLTKTALRRVEIESRRASLQQLLSGATDGAAEFKAESFKPVYDSLIINDLKREYLRLQSELAEIGERYLGDHPKRRALEERISKVRKDIQHATQVALDATESEYREVVENEKRLKQLLTGAKEDALAVNKLEVDYERLRREKDLNQQVYDLMVKRQKEVDVAGLLRTNNIRSLDAALVPKVASRPNRRQIVSLAALFGLVMGVVLVVLLEVLDSTVKSQDDIESYLGLPFLGILPSIPELTAEVNSRENTVQRDLYVLSNPSSAISECARAIRTSLLFSSPDRPFRTLLVASCGPREGKSTCAVSIAITMAQSGSRVLLIDADLRRPRLHRTFGGRSGAHGLSTLILGDCAIEEAVQSTEIERMFVLPAGPVPPNPAELLHSIRCTEVLAELARRFDRVIIDSPPVGVVTDALVLSAQADGVVMVLRAGSTPKKAATRGKRAILDVKAHIYGAILNDVDLGSHVGRYYYYYRYGYYPSERYPTQGTPGGPGEPPAGSPGPGGPEGSGGDSGGGGTVTASAGGDEVRKDERRDGKKKRAA